ncbi:hypothetical protein QQS45_06360 [Alteriqipengyuania flavescens]|uniref:hypothetical protein n=1 Tax=Alteriqipengyuania flavescens TaxID=3053610 RepID=UPI0025B53B43|nr:hypothetical protein [Alteriqipengyuania flavescens]WJY19832.1 hypothetical protein QQW98_06355 [Alteriqipengyuania flavescens]WJY25774.1 hypothetical protein QQS45_06360 [Alteriqipengyuania flavescens]
MGTWSIDQLENHVTANKRDNEELQLVLGELGYRKMQRSMELKDLVKRLIDKNRRAQIASIGPLFKDFD